MQLDLTNYASVEAAREAMRVQIDAEAGKARAKYITTTPGQSETYTAKYQQAIDYIAAGYPADTGPYPWIAHESTTTGLTPTQTANRIKATGDAWVNVLGPTIEGLRVGGKDRLAGCATVADVLTSARASVAALQAV